METKNAIPVSLWQFPPDEMLSVSDVANAVKICKRTVIARIEDGGIKALRLGTDVKPIYRIPRAEAERYFNSRYY